MYSILIFFDLPVTITEFILWEFAKFVFLADRLHAFFNYETPIHNKSSMETPTKPANYPSDVLKLYVAASWGIGVKFCSRRDPWRFFVP